MDLKESMVAAIVKEIEMQKDYLANEQIGTIYFGGGTPSLLSKDDLGKIIHIIRRLHKVDQQAEITLEANPDDLSDDKLLELREVGVNRLSIGIQSFQDDVLRFFNRAHDSVEAVRCIANARAAGFNNISIDLIYGVPGQPNDVWKKGIEEALSFRPEHISAYSLTIEERTVFGKWKASNKLTPMDEELVAEQFEMLMDILIKNGYEHYEISNFSLPGFRSQHNSSYWRGVKYLGIGPSAHSYDEKSRQFNVSNNSIYIRKILANEIPFEREELSEEDKVNEFFLIGLRTKEGCDLDTIGFRFSSEQMRYVNQLVALGKVTFDGRFLRLTDKGKLLADKIASDLFVSSEE